MAGISKNTFLRWIKQDVLSDVDSQDRHGWRLFTPDDIERLKAEANRVERVNQPKTGGLNANGEIA